MSFLNKIWSVGLLAFMLMALAPGKSTAQDYYISDQDFYDNLSPYGVWVYDPQYGDMWVPDVDENFRPYATRGYWVLTEYGNTWVSDYPWGWATFHYGRWVFDDYYGWAWIPGYEWAPAWVSWRQTAGYYGWAPLTPNISIDISFGGGYTIPDNYWVFAPQTYINSPRIYDYYVPHTRVVNIIRNTTVINNVYSRDNRRYIAGPRMQDIERVTRTRPRIYNINDANKPGAVNIRNKTVNIYRPAVRRAPDARPERVVDGNVYKRENPNASIARRAAGGAPVYNRENASKLATVARNATPNNNVVRVNNRGGNNRPSNDRMNNDNRPGNRDGRIRSARPEMRPNIDPQAATQPENNRFDRRREPNGTPNINNGQAQPNNIERNRGGEARQRNGELNRSTPDASTQQIDAQRQQQREAQRQQRELQRQQQDAQRRSQQNAQQQDVQRQQMDAQRQQQRELQRQQQDAQRQSQQQDLQRQQMDVQRQQQRELQRQQQDAQRQSQQQDLQRQQMDVQRQQQREAQRQQQDAQRQQRDMQRQQQDAQRQAQQNAQQQEMQRQQRDAQRQQQDMQQRQAQDAQRQVAQQQGQQQREAQRQGRPARQVMPGQ
jgi:hypothetical protein